MTVPGPRQETAGTADVIVPDGVRERALRLADALPAYVYDLAALDSHAATVRRALPGIELYYAVKANPDPALLHVLAPYADGFEVSSIGEVAHVRSVLPDARLAFGGPGKTDAELALDVHRLHVESPGELRRLIDMDVPADALLRVNLDVPVHGASLAMGGGATPFGMDPDGVLECLRLTDAQSLGPTGDHNHAKSLRPVDGQNRVESLRPTGGQNRVESLRPTGGQNRVRLRGVHAHLASGLDAPALLGLAEAVLAFGRGLEATEINLGGGMAVSYDAPDKLFDWQRYGLGLNALRAPGETLRIEPGRALTAYCGWYLTRVLDVKRVHGEVFAVLTGGTHHLRTPVAKGHDHPFAVLPTGRPGTGITDEPVTLAGQLCTPKDVFARRVVTSVNTGDIIAFAMAGAYAWTISHHDFLMHPKPAFHYLT
ncbi:diaminopimelate decarboxylase [Sphaerisporangium siamense]|uniref:Diaminopimelate decarboxylase n=1 Tax=Sphaerisporangium siamense TaxID=795645 RepID=A0A7W7G7X0_9ACTN|nr:type III PLP-dependent enzyme [Sphaerisporangium siamense]MBB4701093.1 diaminopimelate decarboxylase [Sphaerisporangium siamense]GII89367.1 diaminopimelate decarboxylase [Sphaerisporangium siamense]